jgi:protocatechuate 3,4-dioxygenase beta subunit
VLKGGQPVANAMMFFSAGDGSGPATDLKQSRSDADGRYQIGLDAAGAYGVVVSTGGAFFGGGRSAIPIQVPDQPNPVLDITMKTAGISGRVLNTEGKPISGAVVSATAGGTAAGSDGHRGGAMQDQSDPDGSFLIEGLDPGTYTITAAAPGYRNATVPPVTIANESDVPAVDVRLEAGRTVRGRVLDANGNPIPGAMVMAAASGGPPSGRDAMPATSDVNGTFLVTAPADGPIDLTAVAGGFPPARAIGVQPEDGVDVMLRAPRAGHVRVSVLDAKGVGLPGARVTCKAVPDYLGADFMTMLNRPLATDAGGATLVSSLAPGAYELTVTTGSKRATQSVTVSEGAEVVATVTVP